MIKQGYNYLGDLIQYMVEFFETSIENVEKSYPPYVPSRNKKQEKEEFQEKERCNLYIFRG